MLPRSPPDESVDCYYYVLTTLYCSRTLRTYGYTARLRRCGTGRGRTHGGVQLYTIFNDIAPRSCIYRTLAGKEFIIGGRCPRSPLTLTGPPR